MTIGSMEEALQPMRSRRVALVTGANGFIAGHLIERLAALGFDVVGVARRRGSCLLPGRIFTMPRLDNEAAMTAMLDHVRPQVIFHLAGSTKPAPEEGFAAGIEATRVLLAAASAMRPKPRVVLIGSAAEYGPLPAPLLPAGEYTPCSPVSDYGRAKLEQTQLGLEAAAVGLPVVVARLFNVIGPGMGEHLALGQFSQTLSAMRPGGGVLVTGDLRGKRDFVSVEDTARLLVELAFHDGALGRVIPICSGYAYQMRDVVAELIQASGLEVSVQPQETQLGVSAVDMMVGDPSVLAALGLRVPVMNLSACMEGIWTASALSSSPRQEACQLALVGGQVSPRVPQPEPHEL